MNGKLQSSEPTRRRGQRGVAMMEYLVALVVLSITIGGIAYATLGAGTVGQAGGRNARLNVLVTSFGEAVKALPYEDCALDTSYVVPVASLHAAPGSEVEVVSVDVDCSSGTDPGVQTVTLRASVGGRQTERTIVKRTPEAAMKPLRFSIMDPEDHPGLWFGPTNDPQRGLYLRAEGDSEIFEYRWWCNGSVKSADPSVPRPNDAQWASVTPDIDPTPTDSFPPVPTRNDPSSQCLIEARPDTMVPGSNDPDDPTYDPDDPAYVYVALRVTEAVTNRVGTKWIRVLRPTTREPATNPTAQIKILAPGECSSALPCLLDGQRKVEVQFEGGSTDPGRQISMWEWNFGDGTAPFLCMSSAQDPLGSRCTNPKHLFQGGGDFPVTLYITDNFGRRSARAQRNVVVTGEPVVKPTIANTAGQAGLTATPSVGLATPTMPLNVAFDAAGSHANNAVAGVGSPPGGIAQYEWDFDINDANDAPDLVGLNAKPSHQYTNSTAMPRIARARVTVTDIYGFIMTAEVDIHVEPFTSAPPTFVNVGAVADCNVPLIAVTLGFGCRSPRNGYFDYQWVNTPRAPGDTVVIQVRMSQSAGWGICTWAGLFGTTTQQFTAGAPGTIQTGRVTFSSGNNTLTRGYNGICAIADGYQYEVRTILTNAHGTFESPWTVPPRKTRSPQL